MNKYIKVTMTCLLVSLFGAQAKAGVMLTGFGGDEGYGEIALAKNDDRSSNRLDLPFEVNFFGNSHESFWVNNNGNISFNGGVSAFTPRAFPASTQPMIAPFWSDVDTRCTTCGDVYIGSPAEGMLAVTWDKVAEFGNYGSGRNSFQLVMIDRAADTGSRGDFDVEFRYEQLEWTHGSQAQAGYDSSVNNGRGFDGREIECAAPRGPVGPADVDTPEYYALPGSFSEEILDLATTSNTGEAGVWRFAIRDGALPGETPENPIMPVVTENGWEFDFNVDLSERVFIDPDVSVGYDYYVDNGDNFASVLLPTGYDDNLFELWLWTPDGWVFSQILTGGVDHVFAAGGISQFRIMGIDTDNMVNPDDTLGFVTGLTFVAAGQQQIRQVAVTEFVEVDEPNALLLMLMSVGFISFASRKKAAKGA